MQCKVTFEDDSEVIAHYGVKGMKWGVRNADTLAKYAREGGAGGGGGVPDEQDEQDDMYGKLVEIANDPSNQSMGDKNSAIMDLAVGELKSTDQYKSGEKAVNDLMTAMDRTKENYERSNQLTESQKDELRAKVKKENAEKKRKRREEARESGNPLWMFM